MEFALLGCGAFTGAVALWLYMLKRNLRPKGTDQIDRERRREGL